MPIPVSLSSNSNGGSLLSFVPIHQFRGQRPISYSAISYSVKTRASKREREIEKKQEAEEEEIEEVEEEVPWIQEKALDLVEFTGSVTQAIPGPRVAHTSFPWFLVLPVAFIGFTFVTSFVKTLKKLSSPREQRRKMVFSTFFLLLLLLHFIHTILIHLYCIHSIALSSG